MKRLFFLPLLIVVTVTVTACAGRGESSDDSTPPSAAVAASPAATSDGTAPTAAVPTGVTLGNIQHGGLNRTYRLFVPTGLDAGAKTPLVVGLHGGLGSGEQFAENSHFETEAQHGGFIVVFPDGVSRTWNGGACCGQAVTRGIDDVGFLAALIEHLASTLPVDRDRVFMTGHSNGGIMSLRFGCERPDLVRAIAPVAGSLEVPKCQPAEGVSMLAIHGDADQSHPLEGGQGPRSIAGVEFVSQEKTLELWAAGMACERDPEHSIAGAVTSTVWTDCKDGSRTTFWVVADADHPWPGGVGGRTAAQDRTSTAIDATSAIWAFFKTLD